jgi:polyferredoxin
MNEKELIKSDSTLYASCKTCGEVASWVPYKEGAEWECQACRAGTRQFGRADREKYLRDKITPEERRERVIRTVMYILAFALGAWVTWELVGYFLHAPI